MDILDFLQARYEAEAGLVAPNERPRAWDLVAGFSLGRVSREPAVIDGRALSP